MRNKTYDIGNYNRIEMDVKLENLSTVLGNLSRNEKVFSIDVQYIDMGNTPFAIVKFGVRK